jgi:hypothetical protein
MRAAAALRRPVIFMAGLYCGGNRYRVVFRPLADFSQRGPLTRERAVCAAIERYVALLEEYCRSEPYNWFNFYDFWGEVCVRWLTFACAVLGCTSTLGVRPLQCVAAEPPTDPAVFEQLLQRLSERRHGHVAFTEVQQLSILDEPCTPPASCSTTPRTVWRSEPSSRVQRTCCSRRVRSRWSAVIGGAA